MAHGARCHACGARRVNALRALRLVSGATGFLTGGAGQRMVGASWLTVDVTGGDAMRAAEDIRADTARCSALVARHVSGFAQ